MALIRNYKEVLEQKVNEGKGVRVRWLISKPEGAPNFAMRLFTVEPGGYTPFHSHPWEHEVFILSGEGELVGENDTLPFKEGDAIFVKPLEYHQFKNTGDDDLRFICVIPLVD